MIRRLFIAYFIFLTQVIFGQSQVDTYTLGDIPASYLEYDESCNGPSARLAIYMPVGDVWNIDSTRVSYVFEAISPGFIADQRSKLICVNTGIEGVEYVGNNTGPGTKSYNYSTNIANGMVTGGTAVIFELYAKRVFNDGAGPCNTTTNRINNNTFTITVYYHAAANNNRVGVSQATPKTKLDVDGMLKIGIENVNPIPGMIRYNNATSDFEGYNGQGWISFTKSNSSLAIGQQRSVESKAEYNDLPFNLEENFGYACANTYEYAAISVPKATTPGAIRSGKVRLYRLNGNNLLLDGIVQDPVPEDQANFGADVALYQDLLIVGAPDYDLPVHTNHGQAYIFKKIGNTWTHMQTLTASDPQPNARFGASVKKFGDYVIVGAPNYTVGAYTNVGKVYIFKWNGTSFVQIGTLLPPNTTQDNQLFGYDIDMTNLQLLISAPNKAQSSFLNVGEVHLYKRTVDTYTLKQSIHNSSSENGMYFGKSIKLISDDLIAVGIPGITVDQVKCGAVNMYLRSPSDGQFYLHQYILPPTKDVELNFGYKLDHNENVLAISTKANSGSILQVGSVIVYKKTEDNFFDPFYTLCPSDGAANDGFGYGLSVNYGNIIVGSPGKDSSPDNNSGAVYFFNQY
jgi:hypothetical protein